MSQDNSTPKTQIVLHADDMERQELARADIARVSGIGKFMSLLHSPYIRRSMIDDQPVHSIVDLVTVLYDPKKSNAKHEQEPRQFWSGAKARIVRTDPQLSEKILQLKLPAWTDGKRYLTDVADAGTLVVIIFELHTTTSNLIRHEIADIFNKYDRGDYNQIIKELDRTSGWAARRNQIAMNEGGCSVVLDRELEWWQR